MSAGALVAEVLYMLTPLVKRWIAEGKDPKVEAQKLLDGRAAKARGEAAAAAVVASKPKRRR